MRPHVLFALSLATLAGLALAEGPITPVSPPPTQPSGMPLGSLDYGPGPEADRGNDGGYHPTVSFEVLPGRRGLQPVVDLTYSHTRVNGPVGAGWGLGFESTIERRGANRGVATYNACADDIFVVDGLLLVDVGEGEYRRSNDPFTVYKPIHYSEDSACNPGEIVGWTATHDGVTRVYGSTEPVAPGGGKASVRYLTPSVTQFCGGIKQPPCSSAAGAIGWHLTRIEDAFGNAIDIAYTKYGRIPHPTTLTYNTNVGGDRHQVLLEWASRPDSRITYADGAERTLSRRLASVSSVSRRNGVDYTFKKYSLQYEQLPCNNQSVLVKVVEHELDGQLKPTSTTRDVAAFEYAGQGETDCAPKFAADDVKIESATIRFDQDPILKDHYVLDSSSFVDVDGDGRLDLVAVVQDCRPVGLESVVKPGFEPGTGLIQVGVLQIVGDCKSRTRVLLNRVADLGSQFEFDDGRASQLDDFLGTADLRRSSGGHSFQFVDLDSNGFVDVVRGYAFGYDGGYMLGTSEGWGQVQYTWWSPQSCSKGADCTSGGMCRESKCAQDNVPTAVLTSGPLDLDRRDPFRFADINGDGLPDLVGPERVYFNSGGEGGRDFFSWSSLDKVDVADPYLTAAYGPDPGFLDPGPWFYPRPGSDPSQEDEGQDPAAVGRYADGQPRCCSVSGGGQDCCPETGAIDGPACAWPSDDTYVTMPGGVTYSQWLWRHTTIADVNGDGIADKLIAVPWHDAQTDAAVAGFNRLLIGDGSGRFTDTGSGIGGATATLVRVARPRSFADISGSSNSPVPCEDFPAYLTWLGHFGLADFDQDGRQDVIQRCQSLGAPAGAPYVLVDRGGNSGYGAPAWTDCPDNAASLGDALDMTWEGNFGADEVWSEFTAPGLGAHPNGTTMNTLADLNGDGAVDVVSFNPRYTQYAPGATDGFNDPVTVNCDPDPEDEDHVCPREGQLFVRLGIPKPALGRLTAIVGPRGGRTEIEWGLADPETSHLPSPTPVMTAVHGPAGTTTYRFEGGRFANRRFMGFGKVSVTDATGTTTVRTFGTSEALEGMMLTETTYRADGRPHRLTVAVPRSPTPAVGCQSLLELGLDFEAPYFNPVGRQCVFDFPEASSASLDLSIFVDRCRSFVGECPKNKVCVGKPWEEDLEPLLGPGQWSILEGMEPTEVGANANEVAQLESLRRATYGDQCPTTGLIGVKAPPVGPQVGSPFATTVVGAAPVLDFSGAPGGVPSMPATVERFQVTEWDYDATHGKVLALRELRDVSTRTDTLITTTSYKKGPALATPQYIFPWFLPYTVLQSDADGKVLTSLTFEDYRKDEWTRQSQVDGTTVRERTRKVNELGQATSATNWGGLEPAGVAYDLCGQPSAEANALGHVRVSLRDQICRVTTTTTSAGLAVTTSFDGYSRPLSSSELVPAAAGSASAVTRETRWSYPTLPTIGSLGANALAEFLDSTPAVVELLPEPDGSETAHLTFADSYGRTVRETRCKRGVSGPAGVPTCASDEPAVERRLGRYSTGDVAWQTTWQGAGTSLGAAAYTATLYDDLRRVSVSRHTDGTLSRTAYDVGIRVAWDPLGREHLERIDGVQSELWKAGRLIESTRVDPLGRVSKVTDAVGAETKHEYDGFSRRVRTTYPEVEVLASGAAVATSGKPTERVFYDLADRPTIRLDATGAATVSLYDAIGRVVRVIGPDGAIVQQQLYLDGPAPGRSLSTIDDRGNVRTQYRDALDRPVLERATDGSRRRWRYDGRGRLALAVEPWGEEVTTRYDRFGREVATTRTFGSTTSPIVATRTVEYDQRGRPVKSVDADGVVETRSWDDADRLLESGVGVGPERRVTARHAYDAAGRIVSTTEAGRERRFTLDAWDRVTYEEVGPASSPGDSPVMAYWRTWSDTDLLVEEVNANGERALYEYDALKRRTAQHYLGPDGEAMGTESWAFDALGRATAATDGRGITTRTRFDGYGRVIEVKAPGMGPIVTTWVRNPPHPISGSSSRLLLEMTTNAAGEATRVYRDGEGRDVVTVAPSGVAVASTYASGRLRRLTRYGDDKTPYAVKPRDFLARSNRLLAERDWVPPTHPCAGSALTLACDTGAVLWSYTRAGRTSYQRDAAGNTTRYGYGLATAGLLTRLQLGGLTDIEYQYDSIYPVRVGQRLGRGAAAITTELVWDRFIHLVESKSSGPTAPPERTTFAYDAAGRRVLAERYVGGALEAATGWVYDGRGRPIEKSLVVGDDTTLTAGWEYLDNGLVAAVTYPSGRTIDYRYATGSNRLEAIEWASPTGTIPLASFSNHDVAGRARRIDFHDSPTASPAISLQRTFSAGREQQRQIDGVSLLGPRVETFAYDRVGRLESVAVLEGGNVASGQLYDYSERDHLLGEAVGVAGEQVVRQYEYDAGGRRVLQTAALPTGASLSQSYEYATGNRLVSTSAPGSQAISWDAYGRQRNDQRGQVFEYGLGHHIRRITPGAGDPLTMRYDAEGLRVSRDGPGGLDLYFSGNTPGEVLHHAGPGGTHEDVVMSPSGTVVALINQDGVVQNVVRNLTGSPYRIGGIDGDALAREWTAFGESVGGDDGGTELGFHQTWASGAEDVQIAGVRAYDPSTGRFLTPDPLLFAASADPGEAADLFRYAQNNPTHRSDPTGYFSAKLPNRGVREFGWALPRGGSGSYANVLEDQMAEFESKQTPQDTNTNSVLVGKSLWSGKTRSCELTIQGCGNRKLPRQNGTFGYPRRAADASAANRNRVNAEIERWWRDSGYDSGPLENVDYPPNNERAKRSRNRPPVEKPSSSTIAQDVGVGLAREGRDAADDETVVIPPMLIEGEAQLGAISMYLLARSRRVAAWLDLGDYSGAGGAWEGSVVGGHVVGLGGAWSPSLGLEAVTDRSSSDFASSALTFSVQSTLLGGAVEGLSGSVTGGPYLKTAEYLAPGGAPPVGSGPYLVAGGQLSAGSVLVGQLTGDVQISGPPSSRTEAAVVSAAGGVGGPGEAAAVLRGGGGYTFVLAQGNPVKFIGRTAEYAAEWGDGLYQELGAWTGLW